MPHGVGDVFAALIAGDLSVAAALGHPTALIDASPDACLDAPHLRIVEAAPAWTSAGPLAPVPFPAPEET